MRLKRVRIFGFKTFADRTEFELDGGIVAVVGPNGCGKSNLVDAILWGLGEGNARQLRAQSSQDVIFSGSSNRKPVGFAEVSLLFDNEDGALPVDTSEVVITRRLTRSGDSDYSINRQACRLRDVYELLADSGLGRSGYAIVGQKEIDAALAASVEDRRAWIDEAAGVQRYRAKKSESLRRLATAEDHLDRVGGIMQELDLQREPLREEAEVAKKYKVAASALRDVEIGLMAQDYAESAKSIAESESRMSESSALLTKELKLTESYEEESDRAIALQREYDRELESLRGQQREATATVSRLDADIRLARQRLVSFDELEANLNEDTEATSTRLEDAEKELAAALAERDRDVEALEALRKQLSSADEESKRLGEALEVVERQLTDARHALTRQMKNEAEQEHRRDRTRAAKRELDGINRTMPDLLAGIAESEAALKIVTDQVDELEAQLSAHDARLRALRNEDDEDARQVRNSLAERSALEGRKRGIEATIDAHEGLTQGARAVLEAVSAGFLQGEYVPVAEAINTDRDLALAIETALGNSANDLICESEAHAKNAIAWLKANESGRATFQPVTLMRSHVSSDELRRMTREVGVVGIASELVDCESRHRPVIDSLLGRVCIVDTLDDALRLARSGGWSRLVSLDGEVVHQAGAVTGGRNARGGYGFVQRRADLEDINRELAVLEKTVTEHDRRVRKRAREAEEIAGLQQEVREKLLDLRDEVDDGESLVATLKVEHRDAERSRNKLIAEIEALGLPIEETVPVEDVGTLEIRRDETLKALAARSADGEQAESRLRDAEIRSKEAIARFEIADRRVQSYRQTTDQRVRRLSNLDPERARVRSEIAVLEVDRSKAELQLEQLSARLVRAQSSRETALARNVELVELARASRANASALSEAIRQCELTRVRAETKRSSTIQRFLEEYGMSEEDIQAEIGKHDVPDDAAAIVSRLRRDIRAMGDVNLGAIEAFERVSGRFDELAAQHDDIRQGIESIRSTIRELDDLTREKFSTTFHAVADAFAQLFQKLFGGGAGSLELSNPDDVLESGVVINVTLPGKRRQPLNLLSGGERSLCATAFLFALLHVKPAPLVVLDEVDAPLDGRNVERFAALLTEYVDRIQFIVITHNPATIAAAPIWLGVTMQEPGVSNLVPARLPGEEPRVHVSVTVDGDV